MTERIDMANMVKAVMTEKKVEAPRSALEFFYTITQPLQSAKSAIDHMKYQIIDTKDRI